MSKRYAVVDNFQAGDHFLIFDISSGDWREISLDTLMTYLNANLSITENLIKQYSTPTATGFSVTIDQGDTWLILTPTGGFAAGTVVLPTGIDNEEIQIISTQIITALTLTPQAGSSIVGAPSGLAANEFFTLRYDGVNKVWYRVA